MNSCTSAFQNTSAWELQEWNAEAEEGKKRGMSMERSKVGTKKKDCLSFTTSSKYNNNKHKIVIFYKK